MTSQDVIERLRNLLKEAEAGRIQAIAYAYAGEVAGWGHSTYPSKLDGIILVGELEGCKADLVNHTLACTCTGAEKPVA